MIDVETTTSRTISSTDAASRLPALPALTGLRFVAAMTVLLHHYQGTLGSDFPLPPVLREYAHGGLHGVSLFFVLSGFILVYVYGADFRDDISHSKAFYWHRFSRIIPMYVFSLAVATPVFFMVGQHVPVNSDMLLVTWMANLFLVHAWWPSDVFHLWNYPSWSLSAELLMYALFPLVARIAQRRATTYRGALHLFLWSCILMVLVSVGALFLLMMTSALAGPVESNDHWFWSPALVFWQFLVGCAVGMVFLRGGRLSPIFGMLVVISTILAVIIAGMWIPTLLGPLFGPLLTVPMFALLVLALASGSAWASAVLGHPWLRHLGEASYSLYLLHVIPLTLLAFAAKTSTLPMWLILGTIGGTIAASLLCYHVIERPARDRLRVWYGR